MDLAFTPSSDGLLYPDFTFLYCGGMQIITDIYARSSDYGNGVR